MTSHPIPTICGTNTGQHSNYIHIIYFWKNNLENLSKKENNMVEGMPLNGITLSQAITDPINRMITITVYASYTEFAIERQLGLDQSWSVWSR